MKKITAWQLIERIQLAIDASDNPAEILVDLDVAGTHIALCVQNGNDSSEFVPIFGKNLMDINTLNTI